MTSTPSITMSELPKTRKDKEFPVMPHPGNMLGMPVRPKTGPRERNQPANGPHISEWEAVLVGKKLVKEDAEDDENTFKRSDLPANTEFNPCARNMRVITGRLNVWYDRDTKIAERVNYG